NGPKLPDPTDPVNPNGYASPTYGQVLNDYWHDDPAVPSTDGQVDFYVTWNDDNGNGLIDANAIEQKSIKRHIRWYGMPRNTDGGPNTYLSNAAGVPVVGIPGCAAATGRPFTNDLTDVVPITDLMYTALNNTATTASSPPASGNVSTVYKAALNP